MVTRFFLLLLAMMTGLSAAQAAEQVRPSNAPVSQTTEARLSSQSDRAETADHRSVSKSWLSFQPRWAAVARAPIGSSVVNEPAPAPRIQRSDRARE